MQEGPAMQNLQPLIRSALPRLLEAAGSRSMSVLKKMDIKIYVLIVNYMFLY